MKLRSVLFVIFFIAALLILLFSRESSLRVVEAAGVSGEEIYLKNCAACHDQVSPRIPPRDAIKKLSVARILRTLDFGVMMSIAYPLRREEREAVAKFLGTSGEEAGPPASAFCSVRQPPVSTAGSSNWNGWSPTPSNTRFQNSSQAGLTREQIPRLKLRWAFGFSGDITAFAAPTILNGVLFFGSASGAVQALEAGTGCLYWVFQANGPVRSAILAMPTPGGYALFFSDLIGWFYSVDAQSGRLLWKRRIDEHEATRLTGSPAAQDGIVFVPAASWEETRSLSPDYPCCTFRGSVTALRAQDGSVVWRSYLMDSAKRTGVSTSGKPRYGPSGAPVWSAPTVDAKRGVLYVATGDNYSNPATATSDAIVALELKTGHIVWSQQTTPGDVWTAACNDEGPNCPAKSGPDFDFGSSAMLVHFGNKDLLIAGQKSAIVYALDPDQKGKILWQSRVGKGGTIGGVQWGMASDGQKVYAAVSDSVLLRSNPTSAAPIGGAEFDPVQGGGLTALRLKDGAKAWFAPGHPCQPPRAGCSPAQSAAVTAISGIVFSGSLDGHLRAFSTDDGQVVWDFDTVQEYSTVNGIQAKGGSLDGAGPVIAGGMLFVNSGYPRNGGMPGNVLLAFSTEDHK